MIESSTEHVPADSLGRDSPGESRPKPVHPSRQFAGFRRRWFTRDISGSRLGRPPLPEFLSVVR
ncbi:hypothetical protein EA472_13420 [Natrarchaeobius oligotrophus]|uniref:Uncharacterized protein n=1 Tax=Natrarchaeobius chitinivorans TaxID=1679083 RepID=A0A3N6NKB5_NATCH|nr:hypothetical protein EA472_13420 [Natrarchaeobius chitinivorans]